MFKIKNIHIYIYKTVIFNFFRHGEIDQQWEIPLTRSLQHRRHYQNVLSLYQKLKKKIHIVLVELL